MSCRRERGILPNFLISFTSLQIQSDSIQLSMQKSDKNAPFSTRLARLLSSSGATSPNSPQFSSYLDQLDQLAPLRSQFSFPKRKTVWTETYSQEREREREREGHVEAQPDEVKPAVYLAGNSLGLMPKDTPRLIQEELSVWAAT